MKVGVVLYSGDPETLWSAFRFTNFAIAMGDQVRVFLIGKGVECARSEKLDTATFKVTEQLQTLLTTGGKVYACGTCLDIHKLKAPAGVTVSTLKDMYEIVKESDKVVSF